MKAGQLPPRVSVNLDGGLGVPYHQFLPPLSQLLPGAALLATGKVALGWSISLVLMTAAGFVFAWRLCRWATGSLECAAAGAALYMTAPCLVVAASAREAVPEYFAYCLIPAAMHYGLRAAVGGRLRHWLAAVFAVFLLFAAEPLTAMHYAVFFCLLLPLLCLLFSRLPSGLSVPLMPPALARPVSEAREALSPFSFGAADSGRPSGDSGDKAPPPARARLAARRRYFRAAASALALPAGALLNLWHLGPALFYGGLPEGVPGAPWPPGASVPLLTLMSAAPAQYRPPGWLIAAPHQAGAALTVAAAALAWLAFRGPKRPFVRALAAAALACLAAALLPEAVPASWRSLGPLSYPARPLALFACAAAVSGALALAMIFRGLPALGPSGRRAAALAACLFSLALALPYLQGAADVPGFPQAVRGESFREAPNLFRGPGPLLPAPRPEAFEAEAGLAVLRGQGPAGDRLFSADLAGLPGGRALLAELYYPGLQEILAEIDGKRATPAIGSFRMPITGPGEGEASPGAFSGLMLDGLPPEGVLEVRVSFTGNKACNFASAASFLAFLAAVLAAARTGRREGRRLPAASPALVTAGSAQAKGA
jgi:hypothetical protein